MSGSQLSLTGFFETAPYRSIVKDAYATRGDGGAGDTRLEIAAWVVMENEGDLVVKDEEGRLMYDRILDLALGKIENPSGETVAASEISRRTGLKVYRDDNGGRAPSTIRGYLDNRDRLEGLPSSHPIKRVLRRWARSRDLGHFEDDESRERVPDEQAEPIDMDSLFAAFRLARMIASKEGFTFAPQSGDPDAVEDNERIDYDEIRTEDRPLGDTKAGVLLVKPSGKMYEYEVDLDTQSLVRANVGTDFVPSLPPGGY